MLRLLLVVVLASHLAWSIPTGPQKPRTALESFGNGVARAYRAGREILSSAFRATQRKLDPRNWVWLNGLRRYIPSAVPVGRLFYINSELWTFRRVGPNVRRAERVIAYKGPAYYKTEAAGAASDPVTPPSEPVNVPKVPVNTNTKGPRRVVVFDVTFPAALKACGSDKKPAECQKSCGLQIARDRLVGTPNSVDAMLRMASGGRTGLVLDPADVYSVELEKDGFYLDWPAKIEEKLGNKIGDMFVYLVPRNYQRMGFEEAGTAGRATQPGKLIWMRDCVSSVFAHEVGHNYGLGHSGSLVKTGPTLLEYADASSIMGGASDSMISQGWGIGTFRGLGAPQMYYMGWLDRKQIREIKKSGTYPPLLSLSSGAREGFVAARVHTSAKTRPLWLEWREAKNHDKDMGHSSFEKLSTAMTGRSSNIKGWLKGSLLVRDEQLFRGLVTLLAVIPPGKDATVFGINIAYAKDGTITIKGLNTKVVQDEPQLANMGMLKALVDVTQGPFVVKAGELLFSQPVQSEDPETIVVANAAQVVGHYKLEDTEIIE